MCVVPMYTYTGFLDESDKSTMFNIFLLRKVTRELGLVESGLELVVDEFNKSIILLA